MDYSTLPPEINSARMYSGAGSAPLQDAALAWQRLAGDLGSAAVAHRRVVAELDDVWRGRAATAMVEAAEPYAAWLETAATHCAQTAAQAGAAVEAYAAAFGATVPPPVIAANRAQLAALVATNILGQNTPAIAATEAEYAEMWAQDSAAMNGYAASSAAATSRLPTFDAPPQKGAANAPQAAATAAPGATITSILDQLFGNGSTLGQNWQALVSSGSFTQLPADMLMGVLALLTADTVVVEQQTAAAVASRPPTVLVPAAAGGKIIPPVRQPVEARTGVGGGIVHMSVPPSWAQPPGRQPLVTPGPTPGPRMAIPAIPFMPVTTVGRSRQRSVREDPEYGTVSKVLPPRNPAAG